MRDYQGKYREDHSQIKKAEFDMIDAWRGCLSVFCLSWKY